MAALIGSFHSAGLFQGNLINSGGWPLVLRFLVTAIHPDFSPELLKLTLEATLKTLAFAVCGTALSLLIGIVGGVLSSEVWWQSVSRLPTPDSRLPTPDSNTLASGTGGFGSP